MDDQQGNVIDGTMRARQWRRSRSKAPAAKEGAEARSDAPRGIASSLLVPVSMMTEATSRPGGDVTRDADPPEHPPAESADQQAETSADLPAGAIGHQNPFLVPEAAQAGNARRNGRRSITSLVARLVSRLDSRPPEL